VWCSVSKRETGKGLEEAFARCVTKAVYMVKRRTIILYEREKALLHELNQAIAAAPGRDYRIAVISKRYGISHHKLIYGFRALFGCSVHSFVLECRMERAKYLLRHTDHPVKQIAATCGYASTANFSTAFRNYVGLTPTAYQQDL
jgi:AraC-like DNA-binding protein